MPNSNTFTTPGIFTVRLTVTDSSGLTGVSEQALTVLPAPTKPTAVFTVDPAQGYTPLSVTFDASDSSDPNGKLVSYAWDFGDGQTASGERVTHIYTQGGTYQVRLTVTDNDGEQANAQRTISVTQTRPPQILAQPQDLQTYEGATVVFAVTAEAIPNPTYQWRRMGNPLQGQVNQTLSFVAALADDGAEFTCVATNSQGTAISTVATLQVQPASGGGVISVNFGANTLSATDTAGVVPVARWNNVTSSSATNLVNHLGLPTGVAVQLSGNQINSYSTADNPAISGDHRMMSSYRGTLAATFTVNITGLPEAYLSSGYDLIVYFGGRNDGATYTPEYVVETQKRYLRDNSGTWDGVHRESTATSSVAAPTNCNYVRWRGLKSNTLVLTVNQNDGPQRYGISGLQIVQRTPPPVPVVDLALQGTSMQFTFNSLPGVIYQLCSSSTLDQPVANWSPSGAEFNGDGTVKTMQVSTDSLTMNRVQFYVLTARTADQP